jgi:hypothetical protein
VALYVGDGVWRVTHKPSGVRFYRYRSGSVASRKKLVDELVSLEEQRQIKAELRQELDQATLCGDFKLAEELRQAAGDGQPKVREWYSVKKGKKSS